MDTLRMPSQQDLDFEQRVREREQVLTALRPQQMGVYLEQALGLPHPVGSRNKPMVCRILDVKYEPGDYCTILYRIGEQRVIGAFRWGETEDEMPETAQQIDPPGMWVYLFPDDPALPGLRAALDEQTMLRELSETLPECLAGEARVLRCQMTVERYRPGKRCTLRFDIWLRNSRTGEILRRLYFGKLYHKLSKARAVFEEMQMLSASAPARDGRIGLAHAAAYLPHLFLVLQEPVAGIPLEFLLGPMEGPVRSGGPHSWQGTRRSAAALAALHTAGLASDRKRPITAELARFQERAAKISGVDPSMGRRMSDLAAALPDWLEKLPEWEEEISLIHGDCKPSQFLIDGDRAALLDFDHCGMADPATDVGTYLATLRQLAIRQSMKARGEAPAAARSGWLADLEREFLEVYCTASGRGKGLRLRVTWYEAVALLRKAIRGFGRGPCSPLPTALVDEAWRCLERLP